METNHACSIAKNRHQKFTEQCEKSNLTLLKRNSQNISWTIDQKQEIYKATSAPLLAADLILC